MTKMETISPKVLNWGHDDIMPNNCNRWGGRDEIPGTLYTWTGLKRCTCN